jgi:hypothetical protein
VEDENKTRSRITAIGEQYLQGIKDMGVEVYDSSRPDIRDYMATRGRAVTWFNGVEGNAGPDTTTVLLGHRANDAAIYEEYLHIQSGAARGWIGLSPEDALIEEVQVETQVLSEAECLGMTQSEREELQQIIDNYRSILWNSYHKVVP